MELLKMFSFVFAGMAIGWMICEMMMLKHFSSGEKKDYLYEYWRNKFLEVSFLYESSFDYKVIHKNEYPDFIQTYFGKITDTDTIKLMVDRWRNENKISPPVYQEFKDGIIFPDRKKYPIASNIDAVNCMEEQVKEKCSGKNLPFSIYYVQDKAEELVLVTVEKESTVIGLIRSKNNKVVISMMDIDDIELDMEWSEKVRLYFCLQGDAAHLAIVKIR